MGVERRAAIGLTEDLVEPVAAIGLKEDLAAWHNWPKWPHVPGQVSQLPESDQLPESNTASSKSQLQDNQFPESKTASSQSQLQDSQFPKSKTATSSCNSYPTYSISQKAPTTNSHMCDLRIPSVAILYIESEIGGPFWAQGLCAKFCKLSGQRKACGRALRGLRAQARARRAP